jgi:hypothetical protein
MLKSLIVSQVHTYGFTCVYAERLKSCVRYHSNIFPCEITEFPSVLLRKIL